MVIPTSDNNAEEAQGNNQATLNGFVEGNPASPQPTQEELASFHQSVDQSMLDAFGNNLQSGLVPRSLLAEQENFDNLVTDLNINRIKVAQLFDPKISTIFFPNIKEEEDDNKSEHDIKLAAYGSHFKRKKHQSYVEFRKDAVDRKFLSHPMDMEHTINMERLRALHGKAKQQVHNDFLNPEYKTISKIILILTISYIMMEFGKPMVKHDIITAQQILKGGHEWIHYYLY